LIALTGYGQPQDRARALTAGFAAHLTKPIDSQQLHQVLSANLAPAATGT
jgi:two-component system, sensor histidine kinase